MKTLRRLVGLDVNELKRLLEKDQKHAGRNLKVGKCVLLDVAFFSEGEGGVLETLGQLAYPTPVDTGKLQS
jgi:hypothetical protein